VLRVLTICLGSVVLFFPAYWVLHPLLGADWGAAIAAALMYLGFPALMLKLWKTYPPLSAVPIEPGDPTMQECIDRSMREFARFKQGLAEGRKQAFVKYVLDMSGGGREHVWGLAHALDGEHVVVSLESQPVQEIADDGADDPRSRIAISAIEDWMLIDKDGKCEGGYTNLGLAKIYRQLHGKIPKKYLNDLEHFVDIHPSEYRAL